MLFVVRRVAEVVASAESVSPSHYQKAQDSNEMMY
jgi:hypothetical protein